MSKPLLILRAASEEEIRARNALTAPVWGNRLTVEQYGHRERRLLATRFSRRTMRTWVLEASSGLVASCESFAMKSVFDGRAGRSHGIASVFVEARLRGNNYAAQLLEQLLAKLRSEDPIASFAADGAPPRAPGTHASFLFSEVGTPIYEKVGYRPRPMRARVWRPTSGEIAGVARPFTRGESAAVLEPLLARDSGSRFRIVVDDEKLDWHRERASIYHQFLAPERPDPDLLAGAVAGSAWIAWSPDYRTDKLMVLATEFASPEESAALVEALRRAADILRMPIAERWESPTLALSSGDSIPRDDEIPMIAPLTHGLAPEDWTDYGRGCWV